MVACFTFFTLHQRDRSVIPALTAGISLSSAPKPLLRRRWTFGASWSRGLLRGFLPAQE